MLQKDDAKRREVIAFGRPINWDSEGQFGAIRFGPDKSKEFPSIPLGTIRSLQREGYIDPEYSHNGAPPAGELVQWCDKIKSRYLEWQLVISLIGHMTRGSKDGGREGQVALTGFIIRSHDDIPDGVQRAFVQTFDPDIISIDAGKLRAEWR